jgi:hypothetical protein
LSETAKSDLKSNLPKGQILLEPTVTISQVVNETIDPPVGAPGDYARLTMQVEFTGWSVLEEDLQTVAQTVLEANRDPGYHPAGSVTIIFANEPEQSVSGDVRWKMTVERDLAAVVDPIEAALKIAGKSPEQAASALSESYRLDAPVKIEISPKWWFWMPFLPLRIEVEVK